MHHRILTILLIVTISQYGCKKNYDDMLAASLEKKDYVPVRVAPIATTDEVLPIYAMGRIASDTETKLSFKTGGYVHQLLVREGDYVKKGKLIGTIRTKEIDAQVLKAERALDKNKRDLERVKAMYEDSVATLENVQDLTTLVAVSEADLEIARYNQQFSKIESPVSGRVLRRLAEPNELVSPGQPIFVIASSGARSYIMKAHISDKDISMISYGTRATLSFDAYKDKEISGKVNRISESADPMTGTFEVELTIEASDARIRNGLIGRAALYPSQSNRYVKIPMTSLSEGKGDEVSIFVPGESGATAHMRRIKVARFGDDYVWVDRDNIADQRVITTGSAYLSEGQKIKIIH